MSKIRKLFAKASKAELPKVEEKKLRSVNEIQSEYTNTCARIGNLEYQIFLYKNDIKMLCERARVLNQEGAAAKQKDALEAAEKAKNEAAGQLSQIEAETKAASEAQKEESNV